MSVRTTPRTSHSPSSSMSALASSAAFAASGDRGGGSRRQDGGERPSRPSARSTLRSCCRVTCRRDQASWIDRSRARQASSAGDIRATRRAYQPSRRRDGRAHTCSGLPLSRLSRTAMVALVVATSDSSGIGIGRAGQARLDEAGQLGALALVLAAARPGSCRDRARSRPWPCGNCRAARCGRRQWRPASPWESARCRR